VHVASVPDTGDVAPQTDALKYTRKNAEVRPFETGGEGALEHFSRKTDAALFALGSSSKKRPHNLVLGRFYDHRRGCRSPRFAQSPAIGEMIQLLPGCSLVPYCWRRMYGPQGTTPVQAAELSSYTAMCIEIQTGPPPGSGV